MIQIMIESILIIYLKKRTFPVLVKNIILISTLNTAIANMEIVFKIF